MGYYDSYLEHHGILGQKWGVRRFENAKGHLTAAGLKRYADGRKVTEKEKNAFSAKAAGYRALGKVHSLNSKVAIGKSGKALANAAAKQANKQADKAQKEANEKKTAKQNDPEAAARKKKMIIAGAAVVGTAIAVYGGYKLYQLNKEKNSGKLDSQKALEKVQQQYTKDKYDWNRQTAKLNYNKAVAERYGQTAKAARIDKKLASSPPPLPTSHSKAGVEARNKLASEASNLAKSVTAEGPKSFSKPVQKSSPKIQIETERKAYNLSKAPSTVNNQKSSLQWQAAQQTAKKTVSNTTKIHGQEKFSAAAKANDDLVQELLKKNTFSF